MEFIVIIMCNIKELIEIEKHPQVWTKNHKKKIICLKFKKYIVKLLNNKL